jgi:hypothetical protein
VAYTRVTKSGAAVTKKSHSGRGLAIRQGGKTGVIPA